MAFVAFSSASFTLTLKHVERKSDGSFQYRRRIPAELHSTYGGRKFFVRSLGRDACLLQKISTSLTERLNKEWDTCRGKPIISIFDRERDCQPASGQILPTDRRSLRAGQSQNSEKINSATAPLDLEAALSLYLALHQKGKDKKFRDDNHRVVQVLIGRIGNLDLHSISRLHAEEFRDYSLRTQATATVRRNLHAITAIINKVRKEKQLQMLNPFEGLGIAGEGEDGIQRLPFTRAELSVVSLACRNLDDDIRHIVALQKDTGCRVAEVVGLRVEDVGLEQPIPHIRIRPWGRVRTLKTPASARDIPLVADALWAAERALEARRRAADGSSWLFPRYASDQIIKATHASNTLNKWLRGLEGVSDQKTTHCFRHAMRDRLRAAQVPLEIQDCLGGWGSRSVGQGYGSGYPLRVLAEYMGKLTTGA